ncbi:hypothetical protein C9374_002353 [Naegleria lovaniensis]|uniref:Guanine nucleotide-binding protein subunit beta-like protein n=1 Tax=Naegleria lovaniensis TaxID=51637 RepID=A0AA88GUX6_NAELO|nr:uncharacterized protein C9374_002353 [Naegleria lovaniensis]KAG2386609.1 hypothetical protein C9374_002353 [Naegleria lovaniensis]
MSDYEFDDFEDDFEEDFEDDDEISPPQTVIPSKQPQVNTSTTVNRNTPAPAVLNSKEVEFPVVKNQEEDAFKTIKIKPTLSKEEKERLEKIQKKHDRASKLLELISLDNISFEIIDLPPLSDYEMYQRSFGKDATLNVSTQCPPIDERKEMGMNTIPQTQLSRGVQAPEDLGISNKSTPKNSMDKFKFNSLTLSRFLKAVYPVCDRILESNTDSKSASEDSKKRESMFKFSSNFSVFSIPLTKDREVREITFSKDNQMIVCYGPSKTDSSILEEGLICIWDPLNERSPTMCLRCGSELSSVCCLLDRPHIVIGGCKDGSIVVWDCNQKPKTIQIGDGFISTIFPSFSTANMFGETHLCSVTNVKSISASLSIYSKEVRSMGDYFISLDEAGNVIFWLVMFLSQHSLADSEFGLSIGGKVKLVNSGRMNIFGEPALDLNLKRAEVETSLAATILKGINPVEQVEHNSFIPSISAASCLEIDPDDPSQFVVGTDFGQILRRGRFIENVKPYNSVKRKDGYSSNIHHLTSRVTCIDFSIFMPQYFLAGFDNGLFAIYMKGYEDPIINFRNHCNCCIVDVKWSSVDPSQFYVLTSEDDLLVLNLSQQDVVVAHEKVVLKGQEKDRVNRVSCKLGILSLSQKDKTQRIAVNNQHELLKSFNKNDRVAIGYMDGRVDLHWIENPSKIVELKESISSISKEIQSFIT